MATTKYKPILPPVNHFSSYFSTNDTFSRTDLLSVFGALLFSFLFSKFMYLNSQENSDVCQHWLGYERSMSEADWRVDVSLCALLQFKQTSQTEH
jgi:hypothetical protein